MGTNNFFKFFLTSKIFYHKFSDDKNTSDVVGIFFQCRHRRFKLCRQVFMDTDRD